MAVKTKALGPEKVAYLRSLFTYEPVAGYITRAVTTAKKGVVHKPYHNSPTVMVPWADGTKTNMPVTKLAYILAYGRSPTRRVIVRNGLNRNKTAKDSLIEQT